MKNVLTTDETAFSLRDPQVMAEWERPPIGPVWTCDCGALLEGDADLDTQGFETSCERCRRRYHNRRIGERTWRITLISRME